MRPLDFDLLGCPVTDYDSGEVLGRIKVVVQAPTPGRIAQLALERLEAPWASSESRPSQRLGEPVYDARGGLVGWVEDMAEGLPGGGLRRLGDADPLSGGASFLLVRENAEGEGAVVECQDHDEVESAHNDYMVGQTAACTLVDGSGVTLIRAGEIITPQVLERARRQGLLHRLEATF